MTDSLGCYILPNKKNFHPRKLAWLTRKNVRVVFSNVLLQFPRGITNSDIPQHLDHANGLAYELLNLLVCNSDRLGFKTQILLHLHFILY